VLRSDPWHCVLSSSTDNALLSHAAKHQPGSLGKCCNSIWDIRLFAAAAAAAAAAALQAAYCQVEPTHKYFWQEVARRVGSRTAGECFDRVFASARSPPPAKISKTKVTVSGRPLPL